MFKSIQWSLQLWHAGLLAVVLFGFGTASYYVISRSRYEQLDADLERSVQVLAAGAFRGPPPGRGPMNGPPMQFRQDGPRGAFKTESQLFDRPFNEPPDRQGGPPRRGPGGPPPDWSPDGPGRNRPLPEIDLSPALAQRFGDGEDGTTYYAIWSPAGELMKSSRTAADMADPGPRTGMAPGPPGPPTPEPPRIRQRSDLREAWMYGPFGTRVLVGKSVLREEAELGHLALLLIATGTGVLLVGLAGGWFLSLRAVRPIRAITATAQEISASNLSQRIDAAGAKSELGTLAAVLNDAFARLETAFQQQVRFTADASHELRTPLAVIHTNAQLALSRDRSAEEYRKIFETCLRASDRMKDLVDSLLLLAGADAGWLSLNRSRVDLQSIVEECIEMVAPLAAKKNVSVEPKLQSVTLSVDASRLAQVVTNLLTNAIRYNRDEGRVQISVAAQGADAVITIADTGIGIPAESQAHLFERFYRVDVARSRADGGSGLGLSICKSIVEAHGGTISVRSEPGRGATFTVRLPLAESSARASLSGAVPVVRQTSE